MKGVVSTGKSSFLVPAVLAALLLLAALAPAGCSGSDSGAPSDAKPAAEAPAQPAPADTPAATPAATAGPVDESAYPMLDLAGYKAMVAETKGRVLLVCIWSVNCPACQQELPELEKLADAYDKDKVRVVYASLDPKAQTLHDFFAGYTPIAEVVRVSGDVAQDAGAEYIPRLVIFNPKGDVSFTDSGFYPLGMLQALVDRAIKEQ